MKAIVGAAFAALLVLVAVLGRYEIQATPVVVNNRTETLRLDRWTGHVARCEYGYDDGAGRPMTFRCR